MIQLILLSRRALLAGLVLLSAASCSKNSILNPQPSTYISDASAYNTPDRILALVNGLYTSLKSGNLYGGGYILYSEIRGEEYINRTSNIYSGFATWNYTVNSSSTEVQNVWSAAYTTINSANIFLEGLQAHPGVIDTALAQQYLAEARFLRAVSYYSLITLYAKPYQADGGASPGIPLRLKAETDPSGNSLPRSTVAQVYAQILGDLDAAELHLPLQYATALLNTTRAHRNSAIAFKTRVYLTMGNYQKTIDEAAKIVSATAPYRALTGVPHQLQASATTPFLGDNYTTTESIFSMPMTALNSSTLYSSLCYDLNSTPNGNGEYNLNPQGIISDSQWRAQDARRQFITSGPTTRFLQKYSKGSPYLDYVPVIRYAEVLLNVAEAFARTGNVSVAADLLQYVRQRADAAYVFPADSLSDQAHLVNSILHERRIELLGEGFRSNDLLRNLLPIPAKGAIGAVTTTDEKYIWPLPTTELNTNITL